MPSHRVTSIAVTRPRSIDHSRRPQMALTLVLALLLALAGSWMAQAWGQGPSSPNGLRRAQPVVCHGNEDVVLERRFIETDGNAIEVHGNCTVEVIDSYIVAGGFGVLVAGNGDAEVYDSYVEGGSVGLAVGGNGDIEFSDSRIVGGTSVTGNGDISDEGGNLVSGTATARATSTTTVRAGAVSVGDLIRVDESGVRVGGVEVDEHGIRVGGVGGVEVDESGVRVGGTGGVEVDERGVRVGSTVRVGADGAVVVGDGVSTVVVDGGYVRVTSPGSSVTVDSAWRSRRSHYDAAGVLVELDARVEGGEVHFDLAGDVLFDFGSAAIRSHAAVQLAKVAQVLRERAAGEISVIGHTDSVGGEAANKKLSEARAVSVMAWLSSEEGIPSALMRGKGMGERQPLVHNTKPDGSDDPDGRKQNRRVEIRFASR